MARHSDDDEEQVPRETSAPDISGTDGSRAIRLPHVCGFFLGLGLYRAWIEICFVGSFVAYPAPYPMRGLFDLSCVAVLFVCAALASRLSPLARRHWAPLSTGILMTLAALLGFVAIARPELAHTLAIASPLMGGVGVGLMILLWSELYGSLSPVRIALYYALSQLAGAVVIWTFKGFALPWLAVYTCLLPVVSLAMLRAAWRWLPQERRPRVGTGARFTFPWKPAALVSVYAFAFGLQEATTYATNGPHSGLGMVATAFAVIVGITLLSRWVDFGTIYSLWLPVLMMASLLVSLVGATGAGGKGFFMGVSYAAAELFIMTMVGSLVYRYGASALWLFGIERGVRMLAMMAGRNVEGMAHGWPVVVLVLVAALVVTALIVSEGRLTSNWGLELSTEVDGRSSKAAEQARLGHACAKLAGERGLTQREGEVLLLLAQRKTAGDIERELCVAYGTAKAHIRHVYRKLDIHSRDELFELVGADGGDEESRPAPAETDAR